MYPPFLVWETDWERQTVKGRISEQLILTGANLYNESLILAQDERWRRA